MKNITANFKLKEPNSDSATLIFLKAYFNKERFTYSTRNKIHPLYWHDGTQRPITYLHEILKKEIKSNPGADLKSELRIVSDLIKKGIQKNPRFLLEMDNLTADLNRHEDELKKAFQYLLRQKQIVKSSKLKELMDKEFRQGTFSNNDKNNFWVKFDEFIKQKKDLYSILTIRKYNALKSHLQRFEKDKRYKITFDSINLVFYDKFYNYLLNYDNSRIEGFKGLLEDTVSKYIAVLKSFLQWAFDRGYHQNTAFQHSQFSAKKSTKIDIVTLTENEFLKLYNHDFCENLTYEKVRDVFCFALMTGQRWSDIEQFRREDIKGDTWEFMSVKTKKVIKVPFKGFIKPALDILIKYNFNLPIMSQQKFNVYLKKVGEEAKINEPVIIKRFSGNEMIEIKKPKYAFMSSHMARRSCITILLQKGIAPTTVMKLSGHSDLKTLMKYENTSQDALVEALEKT
ncbi:MAG: site-specific integrase [Bacteroidales bacterium]|nr:site-specific integrase [Bacteroidales bacterium]